MIKSARGTSWVDSKERIWVTARLLHFWLTRFISTREDSFTYASLETFATNFSTKVDFSNLLVSGAVVLEATIFDEWHHSRLIPYKHLVPFDLGSLVDLWYNLCFFIDGRVCKPHDKHAEAIGVAAAV